MSYLPLNIYTGYSFLCSTLKVEDIFKMVDKHRFQYFGICDLNAMHSYCELDENKAKYKSKPIFGATFYFLLNNEHPILLTCYIKNIKGYLNLVKIISLYPKGITLKEIVSLGEGLICIISTSANEQLVFLAKNNRLSEISKELQILSDCFDDFYFGIEIYSAEDKNNADSFRSFASSHSYKTIAFNKILYCDKKDAVALEILQAIKNNTKLERKEYQGPYFMLKSSSINKLYFDDEVENTFKVAMECKDFSLDIPKGKLLSFPYDGDKKEYIRSYCIKMINSKGLDDKIYLSRVNYELDIIEKMGYLDYFLIVQDYVLYAKNNNIPVGPGRGSAAGSIVSYLLGITNVDSIKYNLLFERFLNPMRTSLPDIDVDFADYRRDEIVSYLKKRYGEERLANIVTYQKFGAKASLRDVGRVFSYDNRDISHISFSLGNYSSFVEAYKYSSEFRELCKDDYFLDIIKLAKKIEGLPRQTGIHAAGVILNDSPLIDSIPVTKNEILCTQFDAASLEKNHYLKMDILGLTNLSIIENILKYVKEYYTPDFNIDNIPFDDKSTFDILNKGLTLGLFQLESSGITKALKEVKVDSFDDIVAVLALYRPGPMDNIPIYANNKNHQIKPNYLHPLLEPILSSTYGVIIYQEQIMQIVQVISGFDLGKADLFRRAISKKNSQKLNELREGFVKGATLNHIDIRDAEKIFELIYKFADYGFNKSHSVSYAIITYQMAYLKANYPHAFYCGLLNYMNLNDPKIDQLRQELTYFDLSIALPSISKSGLDFCFSKNDLIIPLRMIKGLNKTIIEQLLAIKNHHITDFASFMKEAHDYHIPETAIISLINSGYFDEFNINRSTLRSATPIYLSFYDNFFNDGLLSNDELNDFMPDIKVERNNKSLDYDLEFNTLGILLSGSLLESYRSTIDRLGISPMKYQLENKKYNNTKIAVIVNNVKHIQTKTKESMAVLSVKDDSMEIEVIVFPKVFKESMYDILNSTSLLIEGNFRIREDGISFIANAISNLEEKR